MSHRLFFQYINQRRELKEGAVYANKKKELEKVKNLIIIFNGLGTHSYSLLKLLAFRWKVLFSTVLFGKMIRFNQKVLNNTNINIGTQN